MKNLSMEVWFDLLGKPFKDGARGPDAYDCVGVFLELQRRLNHAIPEWGSHARFLSAAREQWQKTEDPQPGDGILIHSINPSWHLAVVSGSGYMIHAHPDCGSVVRERYNRFPWHNRIEGFYRWKG